MPAQPMIKWLPVTVGGCNSESGKRSGRVFHLVHVQCAIVAESLAGFATVGIHSKQARIHGADINDLLASFSGNRIVRLPIGNAAVLERWLRQGFQSRLGVECPFLFTRRRIKCQNTIEWRADIKCVIGKHRCCRPHGRRRVATTIGDVSGMDFPHLFELTHIVFVDLVKRGIFLGIQLAMEAVPCRLLWHQRGCLCADEEWC